MKKDSLPALFATVLCLFPILLLAQNREVRGVVKAQSHKNPIPGVSVLLKGSATGTTTDARGHFSLSVPAREVTLVFSFIGYKSKQVKVPPGKDSLVVLLAEDVTALSEVVVIGYGVQAKKDITGSVSTHSAGRAAGVSVSPTSGPGRTAKEARTAEAREVADAEISVGEPEGKAGVLTAGELNDYSKWHLWQDITKNELQQYQQQWQLKPLRRYSVQLLNEKGFPVLDALIRLKDEQGNTVWETRSDNTGKGELWQDLFAGTGSKASVIEAVMNDKTYTLPEPTPFASGINTITIRKACSAPDVVDIAFVVDATGSMGDEIQFLKAELHDVIGKVKDSLPASNINLGSVFYRDQGDEYVTRKSDFSRNINQTVDFIKAQHAGGGGDYPEAVEEALEVAITQMSWSKEARARLLFLVLDAPPHQTKEIVSAMQQVARQAAAKGIRIIPITASGIDKSTEYLMRSLALATNGTYVFLTDDSGIGNPHIKPTTDKYDVELLNKLLVRLITKFTQSPNCRPVPVAPVNGAGTAFSEASGKTTDQKPQGSIPGKQERAFFKLFPNPVKDQLHIEFSDPVKEFFITDITGKIVTRGTPAQRNTTVSMVSYSTGVYFLKAQNKNKWETERFVLNR